MLHPILIANAYKFMREGTETPVCQVCSLPCDLIFKSRFGDLKRIIQCGHIVHVTCLKYYVLRGNNVCPVCKQVLYDNCGVRFVHEEMAIEARSTTMAIMDLVRGSGPVLRLKLGEDVELMEEIENCLHAKVREVFRSLETGHTYWMWPDDDKNMQSGADVRTNASDGLEDSTGLEDEDNDDEDSERLEDGDDDDEDRFDDGEDDDGQD